MKLGITMIIHNKNDIQFVTEFPCLLGHPVPSFTTIPVQNTDFKGNLQINLNNSSSLLSSSQFNSFFKSLCPSKIILKPKN